MSMSVLHRGELTEVADHDRVESADALINDRSLESRLAEAAMVGRAQDGDEVSFEALVRRYQSPVFGLARRMLGDRGEAEDAVQDTFVVVWRRLPTLADADLFRAWVFQIATRRCLNMLRSRTRRPGTPVVAADLEAAADAPSPTAAVPTTTGGTQQRQHSTQHSSLASTRCSTVSLSSSASAGCCGR